jgi:putative oligomerization/nucleic acid binding protein
MLFLYRPRQTWMPYSLPRNRMQQYDYNTELQQKYEATRRVPAATPAAGAPDAIAQVKELAALHAAGTLTDAEFAAAKAKALGMEAGST